MSDADEYAVFRDLVEEGELLPFFGVDGNCFKIGKQVWEAVEDQSDGYRSMLDCVRTSAARHIFFSKAVDKVRLREATDEQIVEPGYSRDGHRLYQLVAEDGHVWLQFGTENLNDYYPGFVFWYRPRGGHSNV